MTTRRAARWMLGVALVWVSASRAAAQPLAPPATLGLAVDALDGDWFVAATSGSFALRRCLSDTRHHFEQRSARTLEVRTACTSDRGVEYRRGFLSAGKAVNGRFSLRYAPLVLSWAPAAWSDFWVLDAGDGWMLVGDGRRRTLSVLSRRVALDESSLAAAMAAARARGFDPGVLRLVTHPSGASGIAARP